MAAPQDPDDHTWLQFIQAAYYDNAPGSACTYCNSIRIGTEEGELDDTGTSAAPPNNGGSPNTRKKKKEKTGKECKHFFCIPCRQGGLCVNEFQAEGRPHFGHHRLQIFRTTYENTVRKDDIMPFLDTTAVLGIRSNGAAVQNLTTRKATTAVSNVINCHGCRQNVSNAKSNPVREENERNARVCSIQCLLVFRARARLVNFRDGHRRKQRKPMQSPLE